MTTVKITATLLTIVALTAAFAQQPAEPIKVQGTQLDEVLVKAIAHSPDIQVAEAKLREADAELRRARMNLIQKVIDGQAAIEAQKRQVAATEAGLARVLKLARTGTISQEDVMQHERALADAKAGLARAEATLNSMIGAIPERLGKLMDFREERAIHRPSPDADAEADAPKPPHPAMADKIRKALDSQVKSANFREVTLGEVIASLGKTSGSVPFVSAIGDRKDLTVTLNIANDVPLAAHLQALQDVAPGLQIFVRDYGLFFTFDNPPDRGMSMTDFWHGGKAKPAPQRGM